MRERSGIRRPTCSVSRTRRQRRARRRRATRRLKLMKADHSRVQVFHKPRTRPLLRVALHPPLPSHTPLAHRKRENQEIKNRKMAALDTFLFTSESVNEGHPDKLCDQVRGARVRGVAFRGPAGADSAAAAPCLQHSTKGEGGRVEGGGGPRVAPPLCGPASPRWARLAERRTRAPA